MQETTNIGLKTYEASDPTDWLADFNYNMNKIDESVGTQNTSIATVTSTANQANSTATLANTTANSALSTANSKASIDDLASSDSTTYSSEKIDELIAGAGGAVIDDTTTSLNSTWSSNKINTEIEAVETIANSKASINDSTASATTTYSSNKINDLIKPYTFDTAPTETTHTLTASTDIGDLKKAELTLNNLSAGYYYIRIESYNNGSTPRKYCWSEVILRKNNNFMLLQTKEHSKINYIQSGTSARFLDFTTDLFYIPENIQLIFDFYSDYFLNDSCSVKLIKVS